jgi:hypothetical protein
MLAGETTTLEVASCGFRPRSLSSRLMSVSGPWSCKNLRGSGYQCSIELAKSAAIEF